MRSMSYNPAENALLINSDEEGGTYRFFKLAGGAPASLVSRGEVPETFSGQGGTAVFIARNRFAVWNRFASTIQVRSPLFCLRWFAVSDSGSVAAGRSGMHAGRRRAGGHCHREGTGCQWVLEHNRAESHVVVGSANNLPAAHQTFCNHEHQG